MWHLTKTTIERWLESLLHIHDTPERTAAAVGIGVAIGFSPFLGLHTVIGLVLAFVLNMNRVAVLAGTLGQPALVSRTLLRGDNLARRLGDRHPYSAAPRLQD